MGPARKHSPERRCGRAPGLDLIAVALQLFDLLLQLRLKLLLLRHVVRVVHLAAGRSAQAGPRVQSFASAELADAPATTSASRPSAHLVPYLVKHLDALAHPLQRPVYLSLQFPVRPHAVAWRRLC